MGGEATKTLRYHSYVVFKTEQNNIIVTEKLRDGRTLWIENPKDLKDRNSLAKLIRVVHCHSGGPVIEDIKRYRNKKHSAVHSKCKHYAAGLYDLSCGNMHSV